MSGPGRRPRGVVSLIASVALTLGACADDEPAAKTSPTVARTPVASPSVRPSTPMTTPSPVLSTRPNVPAGVNNVIEIVLRGDAAALEQLVRLSTLPCGPQRGPGSPPACPAGQPDGTMVEVFPVATCEGELRPRQFVRPTLEDLTNQSPRLIGVYRAPDPYLPPARGDQVAVFSRHTAASANLGAGVVVEGDRVVGLWFGCLAPPDRIVPPGTEPVFLPGG